MIKEILNDVNYQKYAEEAYKKAQDVQKDLNAMVTFIEPDFTNVKEGLLRGVPVVLKDNVSLKGVLTTASSKILSNYKPVFNATIVEKLQDAGAVFIGKSSMDELAMGGSNRTAYTGPVYNPYDTTRISGGSSGGSAALVAAGVCPLAIGSDTGDSIRKPASFCGVVGVKPTYGKISRYGIIPYASSLDHVGYFTRSVEDAAIALEVLQGHDYKDFSSNYDKDQKYSELLNSDIKGKKIAIIKNVMDNIHNETFTNEFNELMNKLKEKGAIISEVEYDNKLMRAIFPTYYVIANSEATSNHSNLDGIRFGVQEKGDSLEEIMINSRTKGLGSYVRERFVIGSYSLNENNQEKTLRKAQRVRRLICDAIKDSLKDVDIIIALASGNVAPKVEENNTDEYLLSDEYLICENYMAIANFAGLPSMTLPLGYDNGLPFGVNITAKLFDEQNMFNIALAIEECTGLKGAQKN